MLLNPVYNDAFVLVSLHLQPLFPVGSFLQVKFFHNAMSVSQSPSNQSSVRGGDLLFDN